MTITAGIVIDSWKLKIFEKHLKRSNYEWTQHPGPIKDTITLKVITDGFRGLAKVVKSANEEASKS